MSIVSVTEKPGSRSSTIDQLYKRTYTRKFTVETSDPLIGPLAVRSATGIPQPGTYYTNGLLGTDPLYEYDQGAFVQSVQADEDGDGGGIQWTVTVTYGPYDTSAFGSDPTLWPIRVSYGGERTEKVFDFDKNGDPIRNSAGDRFGEPVTTPDHISTITIVRNELVSAFDPDLASSLSDTVNNATWNSFAAGRCLMGLITASEPQYDSNAHVYYHTVTYPVSLAKSGKTWVKELLDQGFNILNGGTPEKPIPYQVNGQPPSDPVTLDGSGHKLAVSGTPVTLTFDVYDAADWSVLGIDLSTRLGA